MDEWNKHYHLNRTGVSVCFLSFWYDTGRGKPRAWKQVPVNCLQRLNSRTDNCLWLGLAEAYLKDDKDPVSLTSSIYASLFKVLSSLQWPKVRQASHTDNDKHQLFAMFSQSLAFQVCFQFLFDFFSVTNLSLLLAADFPDGKQEAANGETPFSVLVDFSPRGYFLG